MLLELDISLSDLLSISIDEKKDRQEYLRIKKRTQEESEELKILIDLITAWRYAQPVIRNSNNVYHILFSKL